MKMIKITNLEKKFSGFSLNIEDVEFTHGKIYGLIGSNGCGKSTAMKLIAGLIKPDGGNIDYGGLTQRDMTMVSRKPYFIADSVYKNLIYPLSLRKKRPDPAQIEYYLKLAGLDDRRNQYASSLSSGEQQKLSLIRALIFSPKLLLIDEAFSNLDIESAGVFEKLILERQQREPITMLMVSHQLSHIQRLCEQVCFMNSGYIEVVGTKEEVLLHPENANLKR